MHNSIKTTKNMYHFTAKNETTEKKTTTLRFGQKKDGVYLELNRDGRAMPRHIRNIRHELCRVEALVSVGLGLNHVVLDTLL